MINELFAAIKNFFSGIRPWVIVTPWEQGLRVRFGKWIKLLNAGIHFRIPMFDQIYRQSVRLRITDIGRQTLTTKDGKTVNLNGVIGFSIVDIETLYRTLHDAAGTIRNMARSAIAEYTATHTIDLCSPLQIEKTLSDVLDYAQYGLCVSQINITEFAVIKTYRIIGDYGPDSGSGILQTDVKDS